MKQFLYNYIIEISITTGIVVGLILATLSRTNCIPPTSYKDIPFIFLGGFILSGIYSYRIINFFIQKT